LKKITIQNKENSSTQKDIIPILENSIAMLEVTIKNSIPFKKLDRLKSLSDIKHRLTTAIITPNKAANQLWAFVEDELMLGKTSGLYSDTVIINGDKKLVKVLKIGKIAIFFKDGEKYGLIKKENSSWVQSMITTAEDLKSTAKLFDSFTKNIRTGKFSIKNIIPKS